MEFKEWKAIGATRLSVDTMRAGLGSPSQHIDAIRKFKEALGSFR